MKCPTLFTAAFATSTLVTANLVTYQIDGKTVMGEPGKNSVEKRSETCSSANNFAYGSICTPGNCDCQGDNGCWCWSDLPNCMCMCDPAFGENIDCNCGLGNPCPSIITP